MTARSFPSVTARWACATTATMGILPEALFNYLLRLGWGHGDQEEITREEAIALFDLERSARARPAST